MKTNKGIIGIGLIVAIVLGIVVVGGGAYYLGKSGSKPAVISPENVLLNNENQNIQPIEQGQNLPVVENNQELNTTNSTTIKTSLYTNKRFNFTMQLPVSKKAPVIEDGSGGSYLSFDVSNSNLKHFHNIAISESKCVSGDAVNINGISFTKTTGSGASGGMESGSIDGSYCVVNNNLSYNFIFFNIYNRVDPKIAKPNTETAIKEFDQEMKLLDFKFIDNTSSSVSAEPQSVVLNSLSPYSVSTGSSITIQGKGFMQIPPLALQQNDLWKNSPHVQVNIRSYPENAFVKSGILWSGNPTSDTSLTVSIPSRICSGNSNPCKFYTILNPGEYTISVNVYGQPEDSNKLPFTIIGPNLSDLPVITSLVPSSAKVGSIVKIYGKNFTGSEGINIGNVPMYAQPTHVSSDGTELDFIVPDSAKRFPGSTYSLTLDSRNDNGREISSNALNFTLIN